MYSLFERTEEGYEFEIEDFRHNSEEMVFKCFADKGEIRRADFENAEEMFDEYYNELDYDYGDYYFQKFCRAKWLKTVHCAGCRGNTKCEFFRGSYYNCTELHNLYDMVEKETPYYKIYMLKTDFELFKTFSIGDSSMPEIFYAEELFPSWFGFEEGKVDYNYMLLKLCGKVNGKARYVIKEIK